MRARGLVELQRAAVGGTGLAFVPFLQLEVAEEQLQRGILGRHANQLVHAMQRSRVIGLFFARNRGYDHRTVHTGSPVRGQVEDDRSGSQEGDDHDDQHTLDE